MKESIRQRLEKMVDRFEEVGGLLADPATDGGSPQFRDLSMEYSRLQPLTERFAAYRDLESELATAQQMASDPDLAMREMATEELQRVGSALDSTEAQLRSLLVPRDPRDEKNIFLEVRAGTGGDEAAIFAGDLLRMYMRYAQNRGPGTEIISESPGEHGGYKEVICRIAGLNAFFQFRFESGTHRVQRVPATEAQGRIHTSACTVAIMPEIDEIGEGRNQSGRSAHRHLPRLRRGRSARQQDRLGHSADAHSDGHRGRVPGGALAAQEPIQGDVALKARLPQPNRRSSTASAATRRAAGRQRRSLGAHPHLQFPTKAGSPITGSI